MKSPAEIEFKPNVAHQQTFAPNECQPPAHYLFNLTTHCVKTRAVMNRHQGAHMPTTFNETEIRNAARALEKALESTDQTAWAYHYTEDAVFVGPGSLPVQGRAALLQMAGAMTPLSSVSITELRIEGSEHIACMYGEATWVNGRPPHSGATTNVRLLIVWRKEADGQWRVAMELLNQAPAAT